MEYQQQNVSEVTDSEGIVNEEVNIYIYYYL